MSMHVIRARYGADSARQVGGQVRYISHREEHLAGGRTREIYGLGPRYRELRGDERAIIRRLVEDGRGLHKPVYYRVRLTVNDATAARLAALGKANPRAVELALRDAVEKTFRGAARSLQGVYVIHEHGGRGRVAGHPHAHVYASPLRTDESPTRRMGPGHLRELRHRWGQEVERSVTRHEHRHELLPSRELPERALPVRGRRKDGEERLPRPERAPGVRDVLPVRSAALAASMARTKNAERMAQRVVWRAAATFMPAPLRTIVRVIGRLLPGERH